MAINMDTLSEEELFDTANTAIAKLTGIFQDDPSLGNDSPRDPDALSYISASHDYLLAAKEKR